MTQNASTVRPDAADPCVAGSASTSRAQRPAKNKILENGEPILLYHGTYQSFSRFEATPHKLRWADKDLSFCTFHFTNSREIAATYGNTVMEVHLTMLNPKILNARGATWDDFFPFGKVAQAAADGYDGVVIRRIRDDHSGSGEESTVYVAFSADQIQVVNTAELSSGTEAAVELGDEPVPRANPRPR